MGTPFKNPVRKKRLYVAGPMRGIKDFNFPAFDEAATFLRNAGYEVCNPADRDREKHGDEDDGEYPENLVVHGGEDGCAHASPARWGGGGVVFCA